MRNLGKGETGERSKLSYEIKGKRMSRITSVVFHWKTGWMVISLTTRDNTGERALFGRKEKMNLILKYVDSEGLLFIHEDVGNTGLRTQRSELEIEICWMFLI